MATRVLDNTGWGFESNCYVCERSNEHGLRIPFTYDDEARLVTASFSLGTAFSGAPAYVHGGLVLAILDEAMAWAVIAAAGRFAITRDTSTRFERPVRVDFIYRVEARVDEVGDDAITTSASVIDAKDRTCSTATATFTPIGRARAVDVLEAEPTEREADYLGE